MAFPAGYVSEVKPGASISGFGPGFWRFSNHRRHDLDFAFAPGNPIQETS
jgi:hypothetical protein